MIAYQPIQRGSPRCRLFLGCNLRADATVVAKVARPTVAVARNLHHRDFIRYPTLSLKSLWRVEAPKLQIVWHSLPHKSPFVKRVVSHHRDGGYILPYNPWITASTIFCTDHSITTMRWRAELQKLQSVPKYRWSWRCFTVSTQSASSAVYQLFIWHVTRTQSMKAQIFVNSIFYEENNWHWP